MLHKVEPSSTFCNNFFQLATLKFVVRQVEHAVVIRTTTRSTCNVTMLRDKLKKVLPVLPGLYEWVSSLSMYSKVSKFLIDS